MGKWVIPKMKGITEKFWHGGGSHRRLDGKEGLCEEQRFREGEGEQMENKAIPGSSHCVKKICGHTDSLMNSMGDPRFDRDGREHIYTNLTPNQEGWKGWRPWAREGRRDLLLPAVCWVHSLLELQGSAACQTKQWLWPIPMVALWASSQN